MHNRQKSLLFRKVGPSQLRWSRAGFFLQLEGSLGQVDGLVWGSVSLDCVLSHLFPKVDG